MPQSRLSPQLQIQLSMRSTRQRRSCVSSAYAALAAPATAAMSLSAAGMQWEDTGSACTQERPCAAHAPSSGQTLLNRMTTKQNPPRKNKKKDGKQEIREGKRSASWITGAGELPLWVLVKGQHNPPPKVKQNLAWGRPPLRVPLAKTAGATRVGQELTTKLTTPRSYLKIMILRKESKSPASVTAATPG